MVQTRTMPISPTVPFEVAALRARRTAAHFGGHIEYFAETDSTNLVAERLARGGAAEGTVVIADAQTHGRGRLGRHWVSPANRNLYLSIVLRPPMAAEDAPKLALMAGLATAECVREWCAQVRLKWPNDILVDGRKVSGLLAEMGMEGDRLGHVILGIGVNLNIAIEEFPEELRNKAGSLLHATGHEVDRVVFTDRLLTHLEARYQQFVRQGFASMRKDWDALSSLHGARVCVEDTRGRYEGDVLGLADDGTLRLRDASGDEVRVVAGDVSVVDGYTPSSS